MEIPDRKLAPSVNVPTPYGAARSRSECEHPSKSLCVIGITGTNGKTTVAHFIGQTLISAGHNSFVLGTLNSGNRDLSTPEAADILDFMRAHLDRGGTHFVMEVTSEAIDQGRVLGIDFNVKLLTNITHDHLDYHKTFDSYKRAKLDFMREGNAEKIYPDTFDKEPVNFSSRVLGDFNHSNIKAAACALRHIGISKTHICQALSSCSAPKGRMEEIELGQSLMVLIDYAHTPDAFHKVLSTTKKIATGRHGRLLVLFGCGGNRDRGKRPKMGRIASQFADFLVITDDNPRLENSNRIISEIMQGMALDYRAYVSIPDRREAIEFILSTARQNDVVLLAGKGHETHQILGADVIHFDDREEAERVIVKQQASAIAAV